METMLISPAKATLVGIPTVIFSLLIPLIGVGVFAYIIAMRLKPLVLAAPDQRFDHLIQRLLNMLKYVIGQYRHPRYMDAGIIHIFLFAGFMILSLRSITLVLLGISEGYVLPGMGGTAGVVYGVLKDFAGTWVLVACVAAMFRRGVLKPERYAVPPKYGKDHTWEAMLVLLLITGLVTFDMVFEGSQAAAQIQKGLKTELLVPGTGTWFAAHVLSASSLDKLQNLHLGAYFSHELIFFFFLCFLPLGKHFHIITSLPNVFFLKLNKGTVKPVRWGVADDQLDDLESFGVKTFEDFTWKQMLDFYSCVDCGRCSDHCPANAAGRPLSPRFISVKCRNYSFAKYPLFGQPVNGRPLIGNVLEEDEIWSCTTCGACEEECPVLIEYIDKIVDVRRGMVDDGNVPQSLQKPLGALEKRGNPYGKTAKKRADWIKDLPEDCNIKILKKKETADILYFVDSITSYDDRIQEIGRATARILFSAGIDFGILGPAEKDSGHEVKRFGEEMLFQELRDQNTDAIIRSDVQSIVTADPHAFNALKNDYQGLPPVEHISQMIAREIKGGKIRLKEVEDNGATYTYHDPCYLGRHNGVYDIPRDVIDAIPNLKRVEMSKCKDRSFCCGGGGLMLFYEPEEEIRMGRLRVEMAEQAGADVIVTACPFCLVNIEDAIKTSGLEGKIEAIDLVELIERHMVHDT
ncbi:MAG: (Fe-S)-binding protein [Candidatus Desulfatibia sp.]|uniref:(Fe-S)-binding protein n=1 Tax=Candidatus Desulfatibia sp. TaxID=3101189 RepID=UPI002F30D34C